MLPRGCLQLGDQQPQRHTIMEKHKVVSMPSCPSDELAKVLWHGGQRLLAQAIQSDVAGLFDQQGGRRMVDGRAGAVSNGQHPDRSLQTRISSCKVPID